MQKYTIRPVVLKHKANQNGIVSIRIAVTINRKKTYIATEHRIHFTQWDEQKREVKDHENATLINVSLRRKITEIEKDLIGRNLEGVKITKRIIQGKVSGERTFSSFANEVRGDQKEINRIKEFAGEAMLSDFTVAFLRKYEAHEKGRLISNNTINTTFKYIRRIITQAFKEGLIQSNPFDNFDIVKYVQTDRTYLTEAELKKVMKIIDTLESSQRVTAYYFMLGCYSGLRHSDWLRFDYSKMVQDGFLKLRAKKNKKHVVLPIGKTLKVITETLKELPKPVSNQKCNVMLKAVGSVAGISKLLTTHVGRHSFGYLCASNKIPKSVTAELMGVSVQTVEVYYHLSGENIIQQAAVLKKL